jgi:hypothetical protein
MKTLITLTIVQTFSIFCYGFILPLDVILQKNVALNGVNTISVEQNVFFKDGVLELGVHESWLIEGDKNMRLTATGLGDLKDTVRIVAIYNGKNRTTVIRKNKVTKVVGRDFFERYLSIRSVETYKNYLAELTISPVVRLSRANGAIAFAIGEPSANKILKPQAWIKQDSFQLQKIRFPSEAEISFDDYVTRSPRLDYPNTKKLEWAGKSVTIKVLSVHEKPRFAANAFSSNSLDSPSEILVSNKNSIGLTLEEFYKRFR